VGIGNSTKPFTFAELINTGKRDVQHDKINDYVVKQHREKK
jgi:hypothetical protein